MPKRILIIQTAFLGDAILCTSFVKATKELYPDSKIDILIIPQAVEIFENNPHINKIIIFPKRTLLMKLNSFFKLIKQMKTEQYDVVVSLKLSLTISFLMYLSGIPIRLGYPRQKLLTHTVTLPKKIPVYRRSLLLLKVISDREFIPKTEIFWTKEIDEQVCKYIKDYQEPGYNVIAIAPASIWQTKRWLPEYYSELISMLYQNYIQAVLIGGPDDRNLCQQIIQQANTPALNLAGYLSLKGSAALISKLPLLVTNDSAPLHLANAVETDVIAIFGPTVRDFGFYPFRPRDIVLEVPLPCRPCGKHGGNKCPQKHFKCMKDIKPELVKDAVMRLIMQS